MIQVTRLNGEKIVINSKHIEVIECIPETKITLTNKDYFIVKENVNEIIDRIVQFNAMVSKFPK